MEKEVTVKIKHIVEYLQQFNQEAEVFLDKNGWEANFHNTEDPMELIACNILFEYHKDKKYLIINN